MNEFAIQNKHGHKLIPMRGSPVIPDASIVFDFGGYTHMFGNVEVCKTQTAPNICGKVCDCSLRKISQLKSTLVGSTH